MHYYMHLIFTQRLVGLLVKSVDFSNLCFIIRQRWQFKNGQEHFFSQVCSSFHAWNSKSIKDMLISFYILVLNNFFFWSLHFKCPRLFNPRDMDIFSGQKPNVDHIVLSWLFFSFKEEYRNKNNVKTRNISNFSDQLHNNIYLAYLSVISIIFLKLSCL